MKFQQISTFRYRFVAAKLLSLTMIGLFLAQPAQAEFNVGIYGGKSFIDNSDLNLKQAGTDITLKNVQWEDNSFEEPAFYGARLGYWFDNAPNWGVSVDFAHLKNYLVDEGNVFASGVRGGTPVSQVEPVKNTLDFFNMSHGLNTITFNGQYRWFPAGQRDQTFLGRMQLYTGLGAGFSVPHVEAVVHGSTAKTYEYQGGAGPVVNGMWGVNYDIYRFISGFAEYKLTYASVEDNLTGGGTINTETVNHQLIFGLAAHFDL